MNLLDIMWKNDIYWRIDYITTQESGKPVRGTRKCLLLDCASYLMIIVSLNVLEVRSPGKIKEERVFRAFQEINIAILRKMGLFFHGLMKMMLRNSNVYTTWTSKLLWISMHLSRWGSIHCGHMRRDIMTKSGADTLWEKMRKSKLEIDTQIHCQVENFL